MDLLLSYGIFKCLVDVVCRLHTVVYSLLGWTTRGRHHTPVFRMFDWPLHRDFSLLFAIGEVGSFTCIGCDSPIHGTDGLESPPKDLAMRIKRLAKGRYCRGGIWTHAEPPVWKFAVYTLALRPRLGHDSSSMNMNEYHEYHEKNNTNVGRLALRIISEINSRFENSGQSLRFLNKTMTHLLLNSQENSHLSRRTKVAV